MADAIEIKATTKTEEIRLDKKVIVKSIASWATGTQRKTTTGDISVPPNGSVLLTREEVIAQAQNGNKLLTGSNGVGGHATWYVEDDYTREELSFDVGNKKQEILNKEKIAGFFELKTMKSFEDNIKKHVITRAEMSFLMSSIKALNFNDYNKIAFCIDYTGMKP